MRRLIPPAEDPRRAHLTYFLSLPDPFVTVTVPVDVTALVSWCRQNRLSFYSAVIHASALAAESVPEMRRRVCPEGVAEYDECPTSHTELAQDGTYGYCTLRHHMPLSEYFEMAGQAREKCRLCPSIQEDEDVDSMLFVTCLPWLHYTALKLPAAGDSNPRLSWGRYEEDFRGRLMLPYTLSVHHGLCDGIHIAAFFDALSARIDALSRETI